MTDENVSQIILRSLERMEDRYNHAEEKQGEQHDKLQDKINEIREGQIRQSISLAVFEKDIPAIKEDLLVHIAGTVDNRHRITALEEVIKNQDLIINSAAAKYSTEIEPVITHIKNLQAMPGQARRFLFKTAKVTAAIVTVVGSVMTLVGYLSGWFGK